jgi:hypothetical protein
MKMLYWISSYNLTNKAAPKIGDVVPKSNLNNNLISL